MQTRYSYTIIIVVFIKDASWLDAIIWVIVEEVTICNSKRDKYPYQRGLAFSHVILEVGAAYFCSS